jgi:hypothetical protein
VKLKRLVVFSVDGIPALICSGSNCNPSYSIQLLPGHHTLEFGPTGFNSTYNGNQFREITVEAGRQYKFRQKYSSTGCSNNYRGMTCTGTWNVLGPE